jgi:hypothetical protein
VPQHRRRVAGLERREQRGDGREHRRGLCPLRRKRIDRRTHGLRGGASRKQERGGENDRKQRRGNALRHA